MKKYLSFLFIVALLFTGCGKRVTITCTKNNDEYKATFKNDKITKLVMKEKFETEEEAKSYASLMISIMGNPNGMKTKADGKYLIITTYGKALEEEYKDVTKEDFKKGFEADGYTCK